MADSTFNWKQVTVTATITCVFTVLAGLATYYFTTHSPKLEYSLVQGPPLTSGGQSKRIYVLNVRNTGSKEVEAVGIQVIAAHAQLAEYSVRTNPGLQLEQRTDTAQFTGSTAVMNPRDSVTLSFLLSEDSSRSEPVIAVRGKGVVGEEASRANGWRRDLPLSFLGIVLAATLGSLASVTPIVRRLVRGNSDGSDEELERLVSLDDRPDVIAYILGALGLMEESAAVRFRRADPSFRGIADYLVHRAEHNPDMRMQSLAALECLILSPRMADESRELVVRAARKLGSSDDDITELRTRAAKIESATQLRDEVDTIAKTYLGNYRTVKAHL